MVWDGPGGDCRGLDIIQDTEEEQPEVLVWCLKELERLYGKDSWQLNNDEWPNAKTGEIDQYALHIVLPGEDSSWLEFNAKTLTACAVSALVSLPVQEESRG